MGDHALVIDDDPLSGAVLEKLLQMEGITVTVIGHPAQLADTLPQLADLRVIFVDLELPRLDGYEVLQMLRAHFGSSLPIAAYTVHTSEAVAAKQKGFDAFLGKPVNRKEFSSNLRRILNGENVWAVT